MSTPFSPIPSLAYIHLDTSYPSPSTARVAVIGEVDVATAPALCDVLLDVLQEQTYVLLDVDLAGVTFLDCAGVAALVAVRNAAVRAGRQLRVSHPRPIVGRVLGLTGLHGVLTAPIDQPQPPPTGSGHLCEMGLSPMTAAQPSSVMAAA
jgi:anti-anti-sigma factor